MYDVFRWRDPNNVFRTVYKVNGVPTLARFEKTEDGLVHEVGRLVEADILDKEKLAKLIG